MIYSSTVLLIFVFILLKSEDYDVIITNRYEKMIFIFARYVILKKTEFFIEYDGEKLHCLEWLPEKEVKAVLQVVHGMVEYIDRYDDFAEYLCSRGIAVIGHDHPGHGLTAQSADDLGYIKKDGGSVHLVGCTHRVTKYIKENFPAVPNFIMGHSMGSFVVRRYITSMSRDISGVIIMGTGTPPRIALVLGKALANLICAVKGERHPSRLLTNISFAGYNSRFPKEEGEHAWISSDRDVVKKYDNDPFCSYTFRASGFLALYETLLFLSKKSDFENIGKDLPILVNAGGDDPVGEYGKAPAKVYEDFKALGISDVTLSIYEGGRHEIVNEKNKEKVYADIADWIFARI